MKQGGGRMGRRIWLVVLACFLLLVVAVPVMADPPEPEPQVGGEGAVLKADEYGTPSAASIASEYQAARQKEKEREQELQGQPFVAERESSQHAYAEDTPSEAEELLRSTFSETFAGLDEEPARLLGDVKLDENLGHGVAVITDQGRNEILEADQPIEVENPEGETEKVDLSLERGPEGFEPENPVTEVSIGETAEEGVEVGEEGLTVTQVGAEESAGRLLGGDNVFFGEVEEGSGTDLMVSPTAHGVEFFDMLRSVDSPDILKFQMELPKGDSLRKGPGGGAEIVNPQEEVVSLVPPPHGEDAQGTKVPVGLEVEGDSIVLSTHHQDEDLAYPILIDPEVFQQWGWWYLGDNLQALPFWHFQPNGQAYAWQPEDVQWPGWRGLFIAMPNGPLNAGEYGEYYLNTPNTNVYFDNVEINPFQRREASCTAAPEPYDFEGYWNVVESHWNGVEFNDAKNQGWTDNKTGTWGHQFDFGLQAGTSFNSGCWRDLAAGGVSFHMGDWAAPAVNFVGDVPTYWVNGTSNFSIYVEAVDAGLGVKEVTFTPGGSAALHEEQVGCSGIYGSLCPTFLAHSYTFTGAGFSQGERQVQVSAMDPVLQRSNTKTFTLKADFEPPQLHLKGQLEAAINEAAPGESPELTQPVYNLQVEASDGVEGTTDPALKRSGVEKIEVVVDNVTQKTFSRTCPGGSCGLSGTYPVQLTGLSAGVHHLKVKAWDFAHNHSEVEQEFEYFPATGLTEEDVTQRFALPDGEVHEESSYQGPELAVNVMNGNVIYHQRDVDVEGRSANLEVELFYNSQLPKEESSEFGQGWTLSQTPSLEKTPSGNKATALTSESRLTGGVTLPQNVGQEHFSDKLNAVITKEPGGGYSVSDEGGQESPTTVYNSNGQATEVQTTPTAKVEYEYEGGHLSEIAVDDPGATTLPPPPVEPASAAVSTPTYSSSFGTVGSGSGQFRHPGDVAVDPEGHLWVPDVEGGRLEEFSQQGTFMRALGSLGSGNGQFQSPKSIAFTPEGNFWVADAGNNRLQEFNENGTFVKAVGTAGSGNGQFNRPEGLTVTPSGNIWVSDTYNYRIEELDEEGKFIKVVNPPGLGAIEPTGIAAGPGENVWVTDWAHNRVVELSPEGGLVRSFGTAGTGAGQFRNPDAIAIDGHGTVWVGDQSNDRVEGFSETGAYLTQFGTAGSGAGQFAFSYPTGIAASKNSLWIADSVNNRIQRWVNGSMSSPGEETVSSQDDPAVAVTTTSAGLVSKVEGPQAGRHSFAHSGELLTADEGSKGSTRYQYTSGRLSKITLPNGTTAEVVYDSTGRATKVTVHPVGEPARATEFSYVQEMSPAEAAVDKVPVGSREVTVAPQGEKRTFFAIDNAGDVFKSWNAEVPPTFFNESGTFVERKEKELTSSTQTLLIKGFAPEGMKTIQFVVNGTTVVDEKTCTGSIAECEYAELQWVVEPGDLPAGTMWIEAVLTERLGHSASERWWVTVPYIPPPELGIPQPPKYKEVLQFREANGLDLDLNPVADEIELHERVFDTLGAWHNPDTPTGEVANASWERWGVPLRSVDVAELEYREAYMAQDAPLIQAWAKEHAWSRYGGYYSDERAGGLVRVGFTANQTELIAQMKQELGGLLAAPSRVVGFLAPPEYTIESIEVAAQTIQAYAVGHLENIMQANFEPKANKVVVSALNIGAAESEVSSIIGSLARVQFVQAPEPIQAWAGRYRASGPIKAGDYMRTASAACTAGYGAAERSPPGQATKKFLLSAGHCFNVGERPERANNPGALYANEWHEIGPVVRKSLPETGAPGETDGLAISLKSEALAPTEIFKSRAVRPVASRSEMQVLEKLCFSGARSEVVCGVSAGEAEFSLREGGVHTGKMLGIRIVGLARGGPGDSGAPVWNDYTGRSVGLISGGYGSGGEAFVTPLRPLPTSSTGISQPGILEALSNQIGPLALNEG